jgi:Acyl-CoA dehydrogenase, C-terminal domain
MFPGRHAQAGSVLTVNPICTMVNHETNELIFEKWAPEENLVGEEGRGFRYILSGMNASWSPRSRSATAIYFIDRATAYAKERVVFNRTIGRNQGILFPLAKAYMALEAPRGQRDKAATKFDHGTTSGHEANIHRQIPLLRGWLGGRQRCHDHLRRLWLRRRIRHRAQVPGVTAPPGGTGLQQPGHELRRGTRPRPAEVVLMVVQDPVLLETLQGSRIVVVTQNRPELMNPFNTETTFACRRSSPSCPTGPRSGS